jgi:hypothetical protein
VNAPRAGASLAQPGAGGRFHDVLWLDSIEREVAELGIAVTAARRETVERLRVLVDATRDDASPFPYARISLEGELDELVATLAAVDAEDRYRAMLRETRARDRAAGRTLIGPQASDLVVRHGPKDIPADTASTGEQKALLIGLVLAHASLVSAMTGLAPLVLPRRGRGPSRPPPPGRAVRDAWPARRPGLDDGGRPGPLRRTRRRGGPVPCDARRRRAHPSPFLKGEGPRGGRETMVSDHADPNPNPHPRLREDRL